MCNPSYFGCDGNEVVGFPSFLLYHGLNHHVYLVCLCVRSCFGNLLWQYVNTMKWIVSVGEGDIGVCVWFGLRLYIGCPCLNLAWH